MGARRRGEGRVSVGGRRWEWVGGAPITFFIYSNAYPYSIHRVLRSIAFDLKSCGVSVPVARYQDLTDPLCKLEEKTVDINICRHTTMNACACVVGCDTIRSYID